MRTYPRHYYGRIPEASNTAFYIGGNDASAGDGGAAPEEGELYRIEEIILHPDYDPDTSSYDIALVKLSEAVTGVTPAEYNTANMSGYAGDDYITAGFDESLTGAKKRWPLTIDSVDSQSFYTDNPEYNLGDTGIIMLDDDGEVLGISSATIPSGSEPFLGATVFVRADSHHVWIDGEMVE